jgi:hypothetical protein
MLSYRDSSLDVMFPQIIEEMLMEVIFTGLR